MYQNKSRARIKKGKEEKRHYNTSEKEQEITKKIKESRRKRK